MLEFTRTEYENLKKSKELDEFSPAQFHAWINSNEDLFMKGESGEFDNDLQKSEYNTLQNELAAFVKVGVWEEDKQSTIVKSEFYIREKQVDFTDEITKSENGEDEIITKGIYRDTALNRKLGRVGTEFGSQIEKSRAGTYEDTPENRKLGRVGQRYGESKKEEMVGSGDHKTKKSNLPENFSDVKSVLMAKTWLENKYGKDFKGSQLTDKEIDIYQDIKQKEKSGFYSYK